MNDRIKMLRLSKPILWAYLLATVLLLGSGLNAYSSEKGDYTGRVTTPEGKGIAQVVVSDGYLVTTTDAKGYYRLQGSDSVKFIFLSIPSEYEIPVKEGLPLFYKSVKGSSKAEVNFELAPKEKDHKLVFTVMADPQVQKAVDVKRFRSEAIPDFIQLQQHYPQHTTFVGLTAGDNIWDRPLLLPGYVEAFKEASYPWFQVIGNHDHDQEVVNNDYEASRLFEQYLGPTYYSFNRGDCHFVVLDNILYHARRNNLPTITEAQLRWLKEDLMHVPKDQLLVVGMHAPIARRGKNPVLTNSDALLQLIAGYKAIVFSGHTHRMHTAEINQDVIEYTLSPIMGNSWVGDIATDGCPNGYGVFEIEGNKLVKQYFKATKMPPSYQFKLFPVGSVPNQAESVVAHVWNYHKGWRVSVYENNKYVGKMKRFTGYDPDAYDFFIGPDKPKRKPKLEPSRTANLFYYTPQSPRSEIKVLVTDPFGEKYIQVLKQGSD